MTGDEKFILGEIHSTVNFIKEEHGKQLDKLFDLARETNGQVKINTVQLKEHRGRIGRTENMLLRTVLIGLIVAVVGAMVILGVEGFVKAVIQ